MHSFKSTLLLIALIVITATAAIAEDIKYLYVIGRDYHFANDNRRFRLYKLRFEDGIYRDIDTVYNTWEYIGDSFPYRSQIVNNKFLVTGSGCLFDLRDEAVLFCSPSDYDLLGIENDTVYLQSRTFWQIDGRQVKSRTFFFELNGHGLRCPLKNQKSKWYLMSNDQRPFKKENFSPNGKYYIKQHFCDDKICFSLVDIDNDQEQFLTDKLNSSLSPASSSMPAIPIFWLDNETILSQRKNGEVVIIDINGNVTDMLKIEIEREPISNPGFYKNLNGDILYSCNNTYVIDLENKSYKKYEWIPAGHGFEISFGGSSEYDNSRLIKHNDSLIANLCCRVDDYVTCEDFIALNLKGDFDTPWTFGLLIWNKFANEWTEIDIGDIEDIVGWRTSEK